MLQIVCINAGNYCGRGAEYVNILHDSVRRNLRDGFPGKFVCFTDDARGLDVGIEVRPLPHPELKGWWHKLALFKHGLFPNGDRILYFDLDTVIAGPLDKIAAYDGAFAILRDFYRPGGFQSSVMGWAAGSLGEIWDWWVLAGKPEVEGGDQVWIEHCLLAPDRWQNLFEGQFASYKAHAQAAPPKGANVIVFHGHPRPHEVETGWVPLVWKIGGGTSASLELVVNTDMSIIEANIRHALTLDAKWLTMREARDDEALIIAGGPSLNDEALSLKLHYQQRHATVFAVNNTVPWLVEHGIMPTAHVMADARLENIDFVPRPFYNVDCYYASQCHPEVLKHAGEKLTLWHPYFDGVLDITGNDCSAYIGGGTTAGLKAIVIAYTLGFRKIHLYGFDSCYRDGENHAYKQKLNDGERIVDVTVNGSNFKAAPWMVTQLEDFRMLMPEMMMLGCEIFVHGTGLIPIMAEAMSKCEELTQADVRAREILKRVNGAKRGAEIGVFAGDLSKRLLGLKSDLTLYMVDSWGANTSAAFIDSKDFHSTLSQADQNYYADLTRIVTSFAQDRAVIIRKDSKEAAKDVADESLDFVFIDADHSYEGCSSDIAAWFPKVKPGGLISGHDYANNEYQFGPMVKRAVDEFVVSKNLTLDLGDNFTWFAVKPNEGNDHV